jgi:hypothetical protein
MNGKPYEHLLSKEALRDAKKLSDFLQTEQARSDLIYIGVAACDIEGKRVSPQDLKFEKGFWSNPMRSDDPYVFVFTLTPPRLN